MFLIAVMCSLALTLNDASAKSAITTTLIAKSGQIINGEEITTQDGPCIIIPPNVKNVRIQNNRIGPCGTAVDGVGIHIQKAAHHIYIATNDIHDVSTAIFADHADHPVVVESNTVYGIRGPSPMGQMVRFDGVFNKGFQSRIFANISDKNMSQNGSAYEDHILLNNSYGSEDNPIMIACNKIRGGDLPTGSGIKIGQNGGDWVIVRDNLLVLTSNTGIAIAGGERLRIFRNMIWNRGDDEKSNTDNVLSMYTYAGYIPKFVEITRNVGVANSWLTNGNGSLSRGFVSDGTAKFVTNSSNNWQHKLLKDTVWFENRADCAKKP